jgi:hypothetical protein
MACVSAEGKARVVWEKTAGTRGVLGIPLRGRGPTGNLACVSAEGLVDIV